VFCRPQESVSDLTRDVNTSPDPARILLPGKQDVALKVLPGSDFNQNRVYSFWDIYFKSQLSYLNVTSCNILALETKLK
jgi:hypothetical protein